MALFDFLKPKKAPKKQVFKRAYAANNQGYLFSDFKASEASADTELRPALKNLRGECLEIPL